MYILGYTQNWGNKYGCTRRNKRIADESKFDPKKVD